MKDNPAEISLFGDELQTPEVKKTESAHSAAKKAKTVKDKSLPLAERMRPRVIGEVVGQSHLLAKGKPLQSAFENAHPHSMILWGPPGTGKTTLARLMADAFHLPFLSISAVLGGVKDIRDAV
jgi:putative ATPase